MNKALISLAAVCRLAAASMFLSTCNAIAQEPRQPEVVVDVDQTRIDEGDSIQYRVTVNNVDAPSRPELVGFDDFQVEFLGETQNSFSSIVIINGRRIDNSQNGRRYTFRLTPRKTGSLTIPAPKTIVDGKEYFGRSIAITVRPASMQDLVGIEVVADRESVYPSQSFAVTVRVFVKSLPEPYADRDPASLPNANRTLNIPWADDRSLADGLSPLKPLDEWLGPLRNNSGRGFAVNNFAAQSPLSLFENRVLRFDLAKRRVERPDAAGVKSAYWEYSLSRLFTASRPGTFDFGPATVRGGFVSRVDQEGEAIIEPARAVSRRVRVQVKEVPLEGRPEWFTGAIGTFHVEADLTPRKAKVGDPMTLSITLKGTGMLEAAPPKIASVPQVWDQFRIYDGSSTTQGNERRFTFSVRPTTPKTKEFPGIPIAYFDVQREKYVTLITKPIPLEIGESNTLAPREISNFGERPQSIENAPPKPAGIRGNWTDASRFRNYSVSASVWFGYVACLAAAFVSVAALRALIARRVADKSKLQRQAGFKQAAAAIEIAAQLADRDPEQSADRLAEVIRRLASLASNDPAEGMTPADVEEALQKQAGDDIARQASAWLRQREAMRFASSSGSPGSLLPQGFAIARRLNELLCRD